MNYLQWDKCTILKYLPLKSTVTLKPELGFTHVIGSDAIR